MISIRVRCAQDQISNGSIPSNAPQIPTSWVKRRKVTVVFVPLRKHRSRIASSALGFGAVAKEGRAGNLSASTRVHRQDSFPIFARVSFGGSFNDFDFGGGEAVKVTDQGVNLAVEAA